MFGEFEREMIVAASTRPRPRARRSTRKSGKAIGRPRGNDAVESAVRAELAKGTGILKTAQALGVGTGTVQKIKNEMIAG